MLQEIMFFYQRFISCILTRLSFRVLVSFYYYSPNTTQSAISIKYCLPVTIHSNKQSGAVTGSVAISRIPTKPLSILDHILFFGFIDF